MLYPASKWNSFQNRDAYLFPFAKVSDWCNVYDVLYQKRDTLMKHMFDCIGAFEPRVLSISYYDVTKTDLADEDIWDA